MKRVALSLLAALLLLSPAAALSPLAFSDVAPGHWFYGTVTQMVDAGLLQGYPDGSFRPQAAITRAEFYKIGMVGAVGDLGHPSPEWPWYAPYRALAESRGWVDSGLDWDASISRAEAADFLHRMDGGVAATPAMQRYGEYLSDYATIAPQDRDAVLWLVLNGWAEGDGQGRYNPDASLTRAEAATLLARRAGLTPALVQAAPTLPVDSLAAAGRSGQIITVTTDSLSAYRAKVNVYEQADDGTWLRLWRDLPAVCGSKGLMYQRKQNTMKSPAGEFGFVFAFGAQPDPGVHADYGYRAITPDSYWVLDSSSALYNRWSEGRGDFKDREHLQSFGYQYDYALVIDFNYHSPVKGDGGAIFMHVATHDGKGTAGCIGLSESDLLDIMRWLDPGKNPRIIICPEGDLQSF